MTGGESEGRRRGGTHNPQPRAEHKCPRAPRQGGSRSHKYHHCWRRCYPPPCHLLPFVPMDHPQGAKLREEMPRAAAGHLLAVGLTGEGGGAVAVAVAAARGRSWPGLVSRGVSQPERRRPKRAGLVALRGVLGQVNRVRFGQRPVSAHAAPSIKGVPFLFRLGKAQHTAQPITRTNHG